MMKDDYKRENGAHRAVLAYMKAVKDHGTFDLTPYELCAAMEAARSGSGDAGWDALIAVYALGFERGRAFAAAAAGSAACAQDTALGPRLRRLRGSATECEAARELNISLCALRAYESGQRVPRDEVKIAFARYYNVPVDELFPCPAAGRLLTGSATT